MGLYYAYDKPEYSGFDEDDEEEDSGEDDENENENRNNTKMTKAISWWRKAAEQEFTPAMYNLGFCYRYGRGVKKDLTEAARWWRKAADLGDENARDALDSL